MKMISITVIINDKNTYIHISSRTMAFYLFQIQPEMVCQYDWFSRLSLTIIFSYMDTWLYGVDTKHLTGIFSRKLHLSVCPSNY